MFLSKSSVLATCEPLSLAALATQKSKIVDKPFTWSKVTEKMSAENSSDDNDDSDQVESMMLDSEVENVRRELMAEAAELERNFRTAKELLFGERLVQINAKLATCKAGNSSECKIIGHMLEEAYDIRKQVAKHRREFALEVAKNKYEMDMEAVRCDAAEKKREHTDLKKKFYKEQLSKLLVESNIAKRRSKYAIKNRKLNSNKKPSDEDKDTYPITDFVGLSELKALEASIPSIDLKERKCPASMVPGTPYIVYNLKDSEIDSDIRQIIDAIKETRHRNAMHFYESFSCRQNLR
ncbi:Breast cancer metastasis-suppressor 1-like protein [Cichlidogyrus casuarinus]|uniref:Breast cancer metastasis-suppressor 1-like protein n=1 Tax=Cichlidogyrus casuarinus TaxID=1844966 RepID=A0ABD2QLU1_9PLAT